MKISDIRSWSNKLRLGSVLATLLVQALSPQVPAYDTSHLIQSPPPDRGANPYLAADMSRNLYMNVGTRYSSPADASANEPFPSLIPLPGLRWDGLHYHGIALYGTYIYEEQYAFSPGIPIILRLVHFAKHYLLTAVRHLEAMGASFLNWRIGIGGWVMTICQALMLGLLACQPCLEVYGLTYDMTSSENIACLALITQALMGAPPIALRSAYAEPLFACFSFRGMRAFHRKSYLIASLYFALATCFRTNGMFLVIFILYDLVARPALDAIISSLRSATRPTLRKIPGILSRVAYQVTLQNIAYGAFLSGIIATPFLGQQYLAYITFCTGSSGGIPATSYPRPWCAARSPFIYTFVQSHYWNVGLWRYWTMARAPRIAVAAPILILVGVSSMWLIWATYQDILGVIQKAQRAVDIPSSKEESPSGGLRPTATVLPPSLPYALHALVLSIVLLTVAHVQIALRVLPASTPWAAWAGALLVAKGYQSRGQANNALVRGSETQPYAANVSAKQDLGSWWAYVSHLWIRWSMVWVFVSSVLWLAYLPPA